MYKTPTTTYIVLRPPIFEFEIDAFSFRVLRTIVYDGQNLLGLRPRKASGAARPPLSFRLCCGLRGVLRTLKLTN